MNKTLGNCDTSGNMLITKPLIIKREFEHYFNFLSVNFILKVLILKVTSKIEISYFFKIKNNILKTPANNSKIIMAVTGGNSSLR